MDWTEAPIGECVSVGCGNEVVDAGSLLIFNGNEAAEGSVISLAPTRWRRPG